MAKIISLQLILLGVVFLFVTIQANSAEEDKRPPLMKMVGQFGRKYERVYNETVKYNNQKFIKASEEEVHKTACDRILKEAQDELDQSVKDIIHTSNQKMSEKHKKAAIDGLKKKMPYARDTGSALCDLEEKKTEWKAFVDTVREVDTKSESKAAVLDQVAKKLEQSNPEMMPKVNRFVEVKKASDIVIEQVHQSVERAKNYV